MKRCDMNIQNVWKEKCVDSTHKETDRNIILLLIRQAETSNNAKFQKNHIILEQKLSTIITFIAPKVVSLEGVIL